MKTVLVTGSSGLVGHSIKEMCYNTNFKFVFTTSKDCDLKNYEKTYDLFETIKPDYVLHLAANVGGVYKNLREPFSMFYDNITINNNIIRACLEHKVERLLACLSTCIYPFKETRLHEELLHEGPPHDSCCGYAYGKRMMDVGIRTCNNQFGTNYKCISPTNIYGPNDNFNNLNSHVIPGLITKCVDSINKNKPFIINGSGKARRQFIYSMDIANILLDVLLTDKYLIIPMNIIISTPESHEISIKYCAETISKLLNNEQPIEYDTSKSDGQITKTVDTSLFEKYFPNYEFTSLTEGLTNTIKFYLRKISQETKISDNLSKFIDSELIPI